VPPGPFGAPREGLRHRVMTGTSQFKRSQLLTMPANCLDVTPRASSVSCNLELMPISDCLLCSISFRPSRSLPLAKRLETFISSWHNIDRHRAACSSVNLTSPLISEAPFGKGGPRQAAFIRHPTGFHRSGHEGVSKACSDRRHLSRSLSALL
jgi:hypothetical protein